MTTLTISPALSDLADQLLAKAARLKVLEQSPNRGRNGRRIAVLRAEIAVLKLRFDRAAEEWENGDNA